jgi:argininosuccinate lyase
MKIWSKGQENLNSKIDDYCSGNDIQYDQVLVKWDAVGSIAHALMLEKQGLINQEEKQKILKGLSLVLELDNSEKFVLDKDKEDVHTNIEFFLGEVGKKLHTGRSRNDQIALDMKLYMKDQLVELAELIVNICSTLKEKSNDGWCIMPGYTHLQKAMPTTFSHYLLSYYELLLDDLEYLIKVWEILDKNPLGAGASFGSLLNIDKDITKEKLGFSNLEYNSLKAIGSRGKNETIFLSLLQTIMIDLSKIAQDFILFSTKEFGYINLSDQVTTGSSIMPQKKNADPLEILKAKSVIVSGYQNIVSNISTGMASGYNSDIRETKGLLMKGIDITKQSLEVIEIVVSTLEINKEKMKHSCSQELFATDFASILVKQGTPFREAYKQIGNNIGGFVDQKVIENNLDYKKGKGEPGDKEMATVLAKKLELFYNELEIKKHKFNKAVEELISIAKVC